MIAVAITRCRKFSFFPSFVMTISCVLDPEWGRDTYLTHHWRRDGKVCRVFGVVDVLEVVGASLLEGCTVNDPSLANTAKLSA